MAIQHNAPKKAPRAVIGTFLYYGTDAVGEGEPFVVDTTNGPNAVARPTAAATTAGATFVGVAVRSYPADSGARQIELALPGSMNVRIKTDAAVTAGGVASYCYKGTTGSKVFAVPSGGSVIALTAVGVGCAIIRETTNAAGLAAADLCIAPYKTGVEES